MPLPDALADVFLIIGHSQFIQSGFRCKVAHGELYATMLKPMSQHIDQTILLHSTVEGFIKLAHGIDSAHALKAPPSHGLGSFDKVGQSDDVQCHPTVIMIAVTGIICLLPSACFGNEVTLNLALKELLVLHHDLHHLSLPVTAS